MDVLNFISWLKSKRQVTTVDASQTLIPVGLKDARRKDGYLPGAISVEDLAGSLTPTFTNENTPYGTDALAITEQYFNVAVGANSMDQSISGGNNTAIGALTLRYSNGSANVAVGFLALNDNLSGDANVAIGQEALSNNTSGNVNVAVGHTALINNSSGYNNTAVGKSSLRSCTNGFQNVAFGADASYNLTTGVGNVSIGFDSGQNITTGGYNTIIGSNTSVSSGGINYSVVLGHSAQATASNQFVIGSSIYNAGTVVTAAQTQTKYWNVIINGVAQRILLA